MATPAGVLGALCAKRILAELRKMKDDIASIDGGSSGLVCVGGLAYSRKTLLPEAIRRTLWAFPRIVVRRSEEHTSELQSLMRISYAVFCLKKKKQKQDITYNEHTEY